MHNASGTPRSLFYEFLGQFDESHVLLLASSNCMLQHYWHYIQAGTWDCDSIPNTVWVVACTYCTSGLMSSISYARCFISDTTVFRNMTPCGWLDSSYFFSSLVRHKTNTTLSHSWMIFQQLYALVIFAVSEVMRIGFFVLILVSFFFYFEVLGLCTFIYI